MTACGLASGLIGIGLSRFAYTPLLPALIRAGWFAPAAAGYLGAANLIGYLAGALLAQPISARIDPVPLLRTMLLLATAAFFACAFPLSFAWFFLWRALSGAAGGVIMVLAAPTILPHVPEQRRGLAAGAIFVGVGCGIVASATLVPVLLQWSLARAWQGLGALALLLCLIAWNGWPAHTPRRLPPSPKAGAPLASAVRGALASLAIEYALNAVGLVAHMIFLVDFIARGLEKGLGVGSEYWILFGVSAAIGPVVTGHLADRVGFRLALRAAFLIEAASVGVLVFSSGPVALVISCIIVGAFAPGIVPLVLGRVHELTAGNTGQWKAAWSLCVTAFALGQAAGAYGLAFVFAATGGDYGSLFAIGSASLMLAFAIDVTAPAFLSRRYNRNVTAA
ncbi:MAG: YbfB/YjiJ family MFS transporter [Acetobacteraceae bacterium]